MENDSNHFDLTVASEGSEELNGKGASTRSAPCISAPRLVMKRRVRGALVPMENQQ